jgi:hypothetical protein
MNSSWPSCIFFPSRSLIAPIASLASWWHGLLISEVGRTLTALVGSLGITLKSMHGARFGCSACGHGHHVPQRIYHVGPRCGLACRLSAWPSLSSVTVLLSPVAWSHSYRALPHCPASRPCGRRLHAGSGMTAAAAPCCAQAIAGRGAALACWHMSMTRLTDATCLVTRRCCLTIVLHPVALSRYARVVSHPVAPCLTSAMHTYRHYARRDTTQLLHAGSLRLRCGRLVELPPCRVEEALPVRSPICFSHPLSDKAKWPHHEPPISIVW